MEPPSSNSVFIVNESGRRAPRALLRRAVTATLELHRRSGEVTLLLCTDEAIRTLNARFRDLDEATDVLTFPAGDFPGAPLGDIAISVPYAERQAAARGVTLSQELGYLAIHGTLHLLGFDDEGDVDRAEMVKEMNRAAIAAALRPDENWASLLHGDAVGPDSELNEANSNCGSSCSTLSSRGSTDAVGAIRGTSLEEAPDHEGSNSFQRGPSASARPKVEPPVGMTDPVFENGSKDSRIRGLGAKQSDEHQSSNPTILQSSIKEFAT